MSPRTKKGWKWVKFLTLYMGSFSLFTVIGGTVTGNVPTLQKGVALLFGCAFLVVPVFILGWISGGKTDDDRSDSELAPTLPDAALNRRIGLDAARPSLATEVTRLPVPQTTLHDPELFGQVAKELASNVRDEALWTMAFALENGDEAKTKAHYIRLRVAKLKQETAARPATRIAPMPPESVAKDVAISSGSANPNIPQAQHRPADKSEADLLRQALQEFDSGQHDSELLAKAKTFAAGDTSKVRDLYARFRANALIDASAELQRAVELNKRREIAKAAEELELRQKEEKQRHDAISATPERIQLMFAVRGNKFEQVRNLIAAKPDLVFAYDSEGRTALHLAVDEDLTDIVKLLLESGANPSARDIGGRTPTELARQKSPALAAVILQSKDTEQ